MGVRIEQEVCEGDVFVIVVGGCEGWGLVGVCLLLLLLCCVCVGGCEWFVAVRLVGGSLW